MPERILSHVAARDADPGCLGGKAAHLAALERAGLPVPPWFCVTTAAHEALLGPVREALDAELGALDASDRDAVRALARRLGAFVRSRTLDEELTRAVLAAFDALFPVEAWVAVRSSVVGEDSEKDSFAGQMDTFLYVARADVCERIVACVASAFSERALLYRALRERRDPVRAAVVVQRMVESRAAGVLFTANPQTGDHDEAVVSVALGLGEGVVAGTVEADTFFVDARSGAVVHRGVAEKRSRIVFDRVAGRGTVIAPVEPAEGDLPALSDGELAALVALGRTIEAREGWPQDIEWAIDGAGTLHLLQARAITTLGRGRETLFDSSNVVESYPGLSSPLTFSFARACYAATFTANSRRLGVPERILESSRVIHENLIGLVDGRIYYNILHWYQLFQLLPGFEWALPAWEKALGLDKRLARRKQRTRAESLRLWPARLRSYAQVAASFFTLRRDVADYHRRFAAVQGAVSARALDARDPHALVELYEHLVEELLGPYSVSLVNDSWGQQLHEALGRLIERWCLGEAVALRNDLLCGEPGMDSVAPVHSLLAVADLVRRTPAARALLDGTDPPDAILAAFRARPDLAAVQSALGEHVARFGDRMLHELKLETPLAEEDPGFLVTMLRNYLHGGQDVRALSSREGDIRARAEAHVAEALRGRPLRRALFGYVLRRLREAVKQRENLRLLRARAFGMVRRLFRELGVRLCTAGVLPKRDDVFFLTVDEVIGAVRGHSVTADLAGLVALRRADYARHREGHPAPRVSAFGIVQTNAFESADHALPPASGELRGLGASAGRVEGVAKVVLDPLADHEVRGEILIAPTTDPGWVFLMVASKGIVAEKGSLLSHTAIIGRELGIPTVVGVKDATRRIHMGARLELDGATGVIRILGPTADP